MLHEDYFAFLMNYFSSRKVDLMAETLLACMIIRKSLLTAVVLAVSLYDIVSGSIMLFIDLTIVRLISKPLSQLYIRFK